MPHRYHGPERRFNRGRRRTDYTPPYKWMILTFIAILLIPALIGFNIHDKDIARLERLERTSGRLVMQTNKLAKENRRAIEYINQARQRRVRDAADADFRLCQSQEKVKASLRAFYQSFKTEARKDLNRRLREGVINKTTYGTQLQRINNFFNPLLKQVVKVNCKRLPLQEKRTKKKKG